MRWKFHPCGVASAHGNWMNLANLPRRASLPAMDTFLHHLRELLPEATSTEPDDLLTWGRDWTRIGTPQPCAIAWPRDTAQVAAVVKLCGLHQVGIVPSGGRTGLAAGAVALNGELVLSLARMRALGPVDPIGRTLRVEAGAVNELVQQHCAPHGLWWPVDLASKGSATVGGNIATNAGGVRVVKYGHTRRWVLGLEVVTAAGDVLHLDQALEKDNSGTDLKQLFIGSEGILGIITAAVLKLAPLPPPRAVLLAGLNDLTDVLKLLTEIRALPAELHAFEVFSQFCTEQLVAHTHLPFPLSSRPKWYALVELALPETFRTEQFIERLLHDGLVEDGVLATDPAQARALWQYRERITESLSGRTPHKNDIAVPLLVLPEFVADLQQKWLSGRQGVEVALFGHVADGNLHVNTLAPAGTDFHEADRTLFELVQQHGGTLSAEHGIGLVKREFLHLRWGKAEMAALAAVKQALDPKGILNPGKVV